MMEFAFESFRLARAKAILHARKCRKCGGPIVTEDGMQANPISDACETGKRLLWTLNRLESGVLQEFYIAGVKN